MIIGISQALALALTWGAGRASAQAQSVPQASPRMRLVLLTGELRVEPDNQPEIVAEEMIPYIKSSAIVRVLAGRADFETSNHAMIRARKGDAFSFVAFAPDGSRPGLVRIAAVTDREEPSLNVNVGDKRFRIHRDGVLIIDEPATGQASVRAAGGSFQSPAVDVSLDRALLAVSRVMLPGVPMAVSISSQPGFVNAAIKLSDVALERDDDGSYEVWALHPFENPQVSMLDRSAEAIAGWPGPPHRVANFIMDKYGLPDQIFADKMVWNDNGPWQQTIVYRTGARAAGLHDYQDVIRQSIGYDVTRSKAAQLAKMDMGFAVDRRHGELSVASDSEENNFLAINLAIEVVLGRKTPKEAQGFYTRIIALAAEGKSSPYMERFLFLRP
jgi:hypothetical protein